MFKIWNVFSLLMTCFFFVHPKRKMFRWMQVVADLYQVPGDGR